MKRNIMKRSIEKFLMFFTSLFFFATGCQNSVYVVPTKLKTSTEPQELQKDTFLYGEPSSGINLVFAADNTTNGVGFRDTVVSIFETVLQRLNEVHWKNARRRLAIQPLRDPAVHQGIVGTEVHINNSDALNTRSCHYLELFGNRSGNHNCERVPNSIMDTFTMGPLGVYDFQSFDPSTSSLELQKLSSMQKKNPGPGLLVYFLASHIKLGGGPQENTFLEFPLGKMAIYADNSQIANHPSCQFNNFPFGAGDLNLLTQAMGVAPGRTQNICQLQDSQANTLRPLVDRIVVFARSLSTRYILSKKPDLEKIHLSVRTSSGQLGPGHFTYIPETREIVFHQPLEVGTLFTVQYIPVSTTPTSPKLPDNVPLPPGLPIQSTRGL